MVEILLDEFHRPGAMEDITQPRSIHSQALVRGTTKYIKPLWMPSDYEGNKQVL